MNKSIEVAVAELLQRLNEERRLKRIKVKRIKSHSGVPSGIHRPYKHQLLLDRIGNVEVRIWNNDHPPPHFHAISRGHFDVRVSIETSTILTVKNGKIRNKDARVIESWAEDNKELLRERWKESRPTEVYATI
ncbi:DUF4160 domain-containing protein [Bacillus sp. UNC438CL73TsuS30]|uniref:DUF4160 domain-containing protein n=1 Tax=Bacillus sp. UNC438CL73TsuS30 TaxID=1340434 RepID=UPI0006899EA4|nr:DUF4160 domain-containing protein [Bacillus sp. UNC438CL73TsuS30]